MKTRELFTFQSKYGTYENCYFLEGRYENGNIGLEIWNDTDGPITKVTVNPDVKISDDYIAVKNYSENEGIEAVLISLGIIAEEPAKTLYSGFVSIPIYRLTDKGKEILELI